MRLRNIPRAESVLAASSYVIKEAPHCRSNWKEGVFGNSNPLHIEIGMGKGQFLLELARKNPSVNYVGIERYASVLLRAVERVETEAGTLPPNASPYPNLRFLCEDAKDLSSIFGTDEVDRIYLNFSDPWPKDRHAKRRLTSRQFFAVYKTFLHPDGQLEFKTDNRGLFDFSLEELAAIPDWEVTACTFDLHHDTAMNQGNIMTEYEAKFSALGNPICKLIAKRV